MIWQNFEPLLRCTLAWYWAMTRWSEESRELPVWRWNNGCLAGGPTHQGNYRRAAQGGGGGVDHLSGLGLLLSLSLSLYLGCIYWHRKETGSFSPTHMLVLYHSSLSLSLSHTRTRIQLTHRQHCIVRSCFFPHLSNYIFFSVSSVLVQCPCHHERLDWQSFITRICLFTPKHVWQWHF